MDFGNEGCPRPERTAQTQQLLAAHPSSDEDMDRVRTGVVAFLDETEYDERVAVEGVLSIAGPGYTMDHIRHAPTYEAEKQANRAAMTVHLHNIYRLAMLVQQERLAHGMDEDDVCYNCADGCGSEREALLERCIHNEWHHVRALHILPEYVADPAEHAPEEEEDGAATAAGDDEDDVSTIFGDDDALHGAQPRSPLVDLTDDSDATEASFEGALDLRPRGAIAAAAAAAAEAEPAPAAAVGLVPGEFIDLDDFVAPAAQASAAAAAEPVYPLRRDTDMPRLSAGAAAAASASAPTPAAVAFRFERPAQYTRKGPHRLDDDLVAMMAESCLKGRIDAATAPQEAVTAAFAVIDHQEELEYDELRAGPERFRDATLRTSDQTRAYNALKMRNFNAMLDRLLRIYVLCRMRKADAASFAAAERAQANAVRDANGCLRLPIHVGIADCMYEAMINNEWAAFDNMSLLPELNATPAPRNA